MSPARLISGLSPFGPIFAKELRVSSRRKRNHLLRMLYLGGLFLVLLMFWSTTSHFYGGVAYRVQQQNQLGQEFFGVFSMFCVISMGLIAPVLTSTAIGAERLGKTLPVLLMTPITAWQIVWGKLFSRILMALMLIGLSLPVLAIVRLLGGVELWQMFAVICVCTSFALSSAAIGLFYSTLINRAYAVILLSYATMGFLYTFLPLMVVLVMSFSNPRFNPGRGAVQFASATNPVLSTLFVILPDPLTRSAGWVPGVLVQLAITAALLSFSAAILRRYARRGGERPVAFYRAGPDVVGS